MWPKVRSLTVQMETRVLWSKLKMPLITELRVHESLDSILSDFIPRHPSLQVLVTWTWEEEEIIYTLLDAAPKLLPQIIDTHKPARRPSEMQSGCICELCLVQPFTRLLTLGVFERIVRLFVLDEANGARRELTITVSVPSRIHIESFK